MSARNDTSRVSKTGAGHTIANCSMGTRCHNAQCGQASYAGLGAGLHHRRAVWPFPDGGCAGLRVKGGAYLVKVVIEGEPKEIAALVLAVQERQSEKINVRNLSDSIRGILLEFAEKS